MGCLKVLYYLIRIHIDEVQNTILGTMDVKLDEKLDKHFSKWFKEYVSIEIVLLLIPSLLLIFKKLATCMFNGRAIMSSIMCSSKILQETLYTVKSYSMYFVNGYKFHTESHRSIRPTSNCGVCIKDSNSSDTEIHYYGCLIEVLRLEYPRLSIKRIVLFNYEQFDPTINSGIKVHKQYPLVDVNLKRRLNKYEPFILAAYLLCH